MFCPVCRQELPDNAKFCTGCGANLSDLLGGTSSTTQGQTVPLEQQTANVTETAGVSQTPGATVQVDAASQDGANGEPSQKLSKRKKGLLAGVGSAAAVAIVAIIAVSMMGPGTAVAVDENNFPDETFRAYVADNVDTDGNGKLSSKELDAVTSIDLSTAAENAAKVSDLTGVHHFKSLRSLNMRGNNLHAMPPHFDRLGHLRYLDISYNKFSSKVTITNKTIERIYIGGNENGTVVAAPENATVVTDPEENLDDDIASGEVEDPNVAAASEDGQSDESETTATTEGAESSDGGDTDAAASTDGESSDEKGSVASSDSGSLADVSFAFKDDSGKWGFIDQSGSVVVEASYSDAGSYSDGIAAVSDGSTFSLLNSDLSESGSVKAAQVLPFSEGLAYAASSTGTVKDGLLEASGNYVDASGNTVGESLTGGGEFHGGYAPAKNSSGWGFIDASGNWVVSAQYTAVTNPASVNGMVVAGVCKDGTWTYIDVASGSQAFDGEFTEATAFDSTGHAIVKRKASSSTSKASVEPEQLTLSNGRYMPGDTTFSVAKGDETAVDDAATTENGGTSDAVDDTSDTTDGTTDTTPSVTDTDTSDQTSTQDTQTQAKEATISFNISNATVSANGSSYFGSESVTVSLDSDFTFTVAANDGYEISTVEASGLGSLSPEGENSYRISSSSLKGGMTITVSATEKEEEVITDRYVVIDGTGTDCGVVEDASAVASFHEGLAPVKDSSGSWGFVGTDGSVAISCQFQAVGYFCGGYALAQDSSGKWGVIDTAGNWSVSPSYSAMQGYGAM